MNFKLKLKKTFIPREFSRGEFPRDWIRPGLMFTHNVVGSYAVPEEFRTITIIKQEGKFVSDKEEDIVFEGTQNTRWTSDYLQKELSSGGCLKFKGFDLNSIN